ncbi:MAG: SAM-dependent methyltransferase [Oscillospiraceae bacterium]|nr:SAM-dependent methyltransferase [Oscillospiraceae bacterium]
MITLSSRLLAAAGLIKGGGRAADIGTDHAYLPVYLISSGKIKEALACDIGEGPLNNAKKTVLQFSLEDKIELRLSNGLKSISPDEADEIIICGMGGELITQILSDCEWIKNSRYNFVLQPMTHAEDVRRFLCENGFVIEKEICVSEGKRVYLTLNAVWKNIENSFEEGYYYFGSLLNSSDPAAKMYAEKQYLRILKRADALKNAGRDKQEEEKLRSVLNYFSRKKEKTN